MLLTAAYREINQQQDLSPATYKLHWITVKLLSSRLNNTPYCYKIDSTIYVINILMTAAMWLGRHHEIETHALAIKQIISLRGGGHFLRQRHFVVYHLHKRVFSLFPDE